MKHIIGNLWDMMGQGYAVVIPTNIGWRRDGKNVMGRGVAQQAAQRWPSLPAAYGEFCRQYRNDTPVIGINTFGEGWVNRLLIMFPVKPLTPDPAFSYMQDADLSLIERSARQLARFAETMMREECEPTPVALPLVGCGNGGLSRDVVLPILDSILSSDIFTLVELSDLVSLSPSIRFPYEEPVFVVTIPD